MSNKAQTPKGTKGTVSKPQTPTKSTATRTKAKSYVDHLYERKAEDFPCVGCDAVYQHARGFCSPCYNAARKGLKAGKTQREVANEIRKLNSLAALPVGSKRLGTPKIVKAAVVKAPAKATAKVKTPKATGATKRHLQLVAAAAAPADGLPSDTTTEEVTFEK